MKKIILLSFAFCLFASHAFAEGIGSRVFVVERSTESLAVYDFLSKKLHKKKITGLGNLRHATMIFSPDLKYGYLATRNGKVSRVDLETLELSKNIFTSENSIDNAISQDGRHIAVAEYIPGGLTILDAQSLEVRKKIPAFFQNKEGKKMSSRVTGIVDAPGNKFVCVTIEGGEIWIIDTNQEIAITHKIKTEAGQPYDAMITPDGRFYLVGHIGSDKVSVLDLHSIDKGVRQISLKDPNKVYDKDAPVKLPHMASWAVAGDYAFVPLVGEKRLAVLDRITWKFIQSIPLRGHPVYAVRSPTEKEVWVSFSGEQDDAYVQVVDTRSMAVKKTIRVGGKIYHMDFTPRGSHVLISANRDNKIALVNANSYQIEDEQSVNSPSGIFGVWRAFKIGL